MESAFIRELGAAERRDDRSTEIKVRLLGAYHDGDIQWQLKPER
jgi:hypothetical protein